MTMHAGDRLRERYRKSGDYYLIQRIRRYIEGGGGILTGKSPTGRNIMLVHVDDADMRVVYDPETSTVVTALPLNIKHHRRLRRGR